MFENNCSITGNLTRDPEIRYTAQTQKAVAHFTVAVNRQKRQGEDRGADYIPCVAFDKTAEAIEKFLAKGSMVGVRGRWTTGSYKNREGQTVYTHELTVDDLKFLSRREEREEPRQMDSFAAINEDVPF